jgi:DNA-binding SARP family transcriptional activator
MNLGMNLRPGLHAGRDTCGMQLQLSAAPCARIGTAAPAPLAPRDAALLAWLALEGPTPRNHLAALLWPGSPLEQARNTLRQRLFQLKRQLGVALVEGQATLQLAAGVQHDLLDSGDLLADVPLELGGEFAAWLAQQRERRCTRTRQTLADLADMAERARDWPDALAHAAELLALDPLAEGAHRRLMRLHYLAGDRGAALRAFDACEKLLKHEVGARPSAETLALLATIESSSVAAPPPGLADAVPPSVLRPPHMVGRSAELAALAAGWASAQVVAVIAEAGTGKSRLLQEFAAARPGVVHMSARPGDAGVPFATLARLLRTVMTRPHAAALVLEPGTRQEVARVVPEMGGGALGLGLGLGMTHGLGGGEGQRLVLQRAVAQLLATQPGLQGLLVDDLHFADQASLDMLLALATDEPHAQGAAPRDPLRWALAYRPAEAGTPLRAFVDALADQAVLRPLPLQPLDLAGLAALVDTLGLPGVHGAALAPGLLRRTGGNPLFVLETIKQSWVERKLAQLADTQLMPRPQSVGRLIERRVLQLSASALAVARVAAIAGVDFCVALAEHVLQAPAMALASAIGELEARRSCAVTPSRTTWWPTPCTPACRPPWPCTPTPRWRSGCRATAASPRAWRRTGSRRGRKPWPCPGCSRRPTPPAARCATASAWPFCRPRRASKKRRTARKRPLNRCTKPRRRPCPWAPWRPRRCLKHWVGCTAWPAHRASRCARICCAVAWQRNWASRRPWRRASRRWQRRRHWATSRCACTATACWPTPAPWPGGLNAPLSTARPAWRGLTPTAAWQNVPWATARWRWRWTTWAVARRRCRTTVPPPNWRRRRVIGSRCRWPPPTWAATASLPAVCQRPTPRWRGLNRCWALTKANRRTGPS